jgi:antitoxin (DNA-binding transcriptional repressor) of toxin-antitoxin stability system
MASGRARRGEEIIVTKAGKPYARLGPLEPPQERIPGRYQDDIPDSFFEPLPTEELETWGQ